MIYIYIYILLAKTWLQYFDCLPLKINTFMSSFNNENDQCIKAHLFWFDPPPLLPIVQPIPPIVINCSAKKAPVGRLKAHFYHFSDILYQVNQVFEKGFGNLL